MGHKITILRNWSQKGITKLEKTAVIEFDLFTTVGISYTDLTSFWPDFMTSQVLPNFQILKK